MKPFLFVANFKMNPVSTEEIKQYSQVLDRESKDKNWQYASGVICPSFLHISFFSSLPAGFALGAQHGFPEKNGSYTGEVSFAMLKSIGVEYVIIGHSERRQYFGETNEAVRVRTDAAIRFSLKPLVCVGETETELTEGKREEVITGQVESVLRGLPKMQAEKIIFVYEPRYAIGTDIVPTSEDIEKAYQLIQNVIIKESGSATADRIAILYGGSVKASNLEAVALDPGMAGVLVGKESLSPYEVVKMMDLAEKYKQQQTV